MASAISYQESGTVWQKIILYVETDNGEHVNQKVHNVFKSLPFSKLLEYCSMDYESIRDVTKILSWFLDKDDFITNRNNCLNYAINYALVNLKFLIKSENAVLLPVLHFLVDLFSRCKNLSKEVDHKICAEQIGNLLLGLFESKQSSTIKCEGIKLLTEALMVPNIALPDLHVVECCINKGFIILPKDSVLIMSRLSYAALRTIGEHIAKDSMILFWLEVECPSLLQDAEELILYEVLKCVALSYEVKIVNHRAMAKAYVKVLHVICHLLQNPSLNEMCSQILMHILKDKEIMGLPSCISEKFDTCYSAQDIRDLFSSDKDVNVVVLYLQYRYARLSRSNFEIATHIRRICYPGKTYSLPVLKALSLLYPLAIENCTHAEQKLIGCHLLTTITNSENFPLLITYDALQLTWFLTQGNTTLKLKSLYIWLGNFKGNREILAVLEACQSAQLLVDFVIQLKSVDKAVSSRAAELLRKLKDPTLAEILMKNIPSCKTIGFMLQAIPSLPVDEEEGIFFCKVMSMKLQCLSEEQSFKGGCYYSIRLLVRFKKSPAAAQHFCRNANLINQMKDAAANSNEIIAISAIKLLKTIVKLQRLHRTEVSETTRVDFKRLIRGSSGRLSESLLLLQIVLSNSTPGPVIGLSENCKSLLYHLLEIEDTQVAAKIFQSLRLFLRLRKHLSVIAITEVTSLFVRMQCTGPTNRGYTPDFLLFLKEWLTMLRRKMFYDAPFRYVGIYLRRLRGTYKVDELEELLSKWQVDDMDEKNVQVVN